MDLGRKPISSYYGFGFVILTSAVIFILVLVMGDQSQGPEQPISFSHALHAGQLGISCAYCHRQAARSPVAGIPSIRTCLDCHRVMKGSAGEEGQLVDLLEMKSTIAWRKVYDLPDHVNFSHKRHVRVGIVCRICHGPVKTMERIHRVRKLTMGWCLSCHRKSEVYLTANGSVRLVDLEMNPHEGIDLQEQGERIRQPSIDCATCHK